MASSPVEICNLALAKMGHEGFITSLSEDSKGAKYMNAFYAPMRDELIRSHLWRFARKSVTLAPLVETPPFDGAYYFQYPDDCLRIVGTDQSYLFSGDKWAREGDKIIANTNVLNLVYLYRVETVSYMDASFVDALACRLAFEGCMPIMKDSGLKEQLRREARDALVRAAHASATEQDGQKFISEAFIGVR